MFGGVCPIVSQQLQIKLFPLPYVFQDTYTSRRRTMNRGQVLALESLLPSPNQHDTIITKVPQQHPAYQQALPPPKRRRRPHPPKLDAKLSRRLSTPPPRAASSSLSAPWLSACSLSAPWLSAPSLSAPSTSTHYSQRPSRRCRQTLGRRQQGCW